MPPGGLRKYGGDLYRLLRVPRTATGSEIKESYRRIALALHPDRHGGCESKTAEFKEVGEAYRVLSDHARRTEYDRWLDEVTVGDDGTVRRRGASRAAERNPFYRKVYSPAAPPGMKTFDRQRHYDMHYGDGMMKEEIQRARRRAEAASPRRSGYDYTSPLGPGFGFDSGRPMREQMNPYSRRGRRQHDHIVNGGVEVEYEEAYVDMGSGGGLSSPSPSRGGKESVVERMRARRRERRRERGDANPYKRAAAGAGSEAWSGTACSIM